jgi:hypothetical protein
LLLLALAMTSQAGCGSPACTFRGTLNDPANLSMRRSMMRKGLGDFCKQMTTRSAPLRLAPDAPVIGRYYPVQCSAGEPTELINVSFSGYGYAWTNVTKKMTFTGGGTAAYRYDFQVTEGDKCDVYAYFRPARVDASDFRVHRIEAPVTSVFNAFSAFGDNLGRQLVSRKLQEGFTVIAHGADTDRSEFALGVVPIGKKPFHPYQVDPGDGRITVENERVEIHQNQRDFVGPIVVEESGRSIFLRVSVDGIQAIDVMLVRKAEGDASLKLYFEYPQSGPLAAPPMTSEIVQMGMELRRGIPVAPGMYYVVFDNTPSAGQVAPPMNLLDDRAAVVNYLIQVGDAS